VGQVPQKGCNFKVHCTKGAPGQGKRGKLEAPASSKFRRWFFWGREGGAIGKGSAGTWQEKKRAHKGRAALSSVQTQPGGGEGNKKEALRKEGDQRGKPKSDLVKKKEARERRRGQKFVRNIQETKESRPELAVPCYALQPGKQEKKIHGNTVFANTTRGQPKDGKPFLRKACVLRKRRFWV